MMNAPQIEVRPRVFVRLSAVISNDEFERTACQIEQELDQFMWEQKRPAMIDEAFRTRWRRGVPTAQRVASMDCA